MKEVMRTIAAVIAAIALSAAACTRDATTRTDRAEAHEEDTTQELAEAGEAVGAAAVQVGQAARVAVQNAAETAQENTDETNAADPSDQPSHGGRS